MEERLIEKDDPRKIRIVKRGEETDAVDDLAEGETAEEAEYAEDALLDLPEDYDEDLVGLTPSMLAEKLAEQERARAQRREACEKAIAEGVALRDKKDMDGAAQAFRRATLEDPESEEAHRLLWQTLTAEYTEVAGFYGEGAAEAFSEAPDAVKEEIRTHMRGALERASDELAAEAEPLRAAVEESMQTRRAAFGAHRRYMRVRFFACLAVVLLFAAGSAIAASYIVRVRGAIALIFTLVFGGVALVALGVTCYFARKLYLADRMCAANEKLASTQDGARLAVLEAKLSALDLALGKEKAQ